MTAARTGHPHPVQLLLDAGAAPDTVDKKEQSALIRAAAEGHFRVPVGGLRCLKAIKGLHGLVGQP